jgi:uncharacterized integral membrane protein
MKTKIILFIIIVVLFTFFVSQNTQMVTISFFFWQFSFSAIILIVMTGSLGLLLGLILGSIFRSPDKNKKNIPPSDNVKTISESP